MDASQQRLGEIGRGFGAEPPRHEGADRFVALIAPRRDEQLRTHPSLPGPREQARPDERTPFGRNPEHGGRRQCVKTTITLNEREPWQLRRHQLIAEAKLFAELDPLRLLNEQGVWSTIDNVMNRYGHLFDTLQDDLAARQEEAYRAGGGVG